MLGKSEGCMKNLIIYHLKAVFYHLNTACKLDLGTQLVWHPLKCITSLNSVANICVGKKSKFD
jgi:hypothetical protein